MAVNLHTTRFRFGIDELAENTHGWHAAENANPAQGVIPNNANFLLRFTVQETGGTAAANTDLQFQCRKNAGVWQNITTTSTIVKAVAAAALTNGGNCTKRLGGTGTFEVSGAGQTEDGLSGGAANDIAASGNSETECGLQIVGADVSGGDTIEFRLTSPDFAITNDVVPTLIVEVGAITGTLNKALGILTAASDGDVAVVGSLAKTLGLATLVGDVDVALVGVVNKAFGAVTLAASGSGGSIITGDLTKTLGALVAAGDGDVAVVGSLIRTFGGLALSAYSGGEPPGGSDPEGREDMQEVVVLGRRRREIVELDEPPPGWWRKQHKDKN